MATWTDTLLGGSDAVPDDAQDRCPDDNALQGYAEGTLDSATSAAVERHIARCQACRRLVFLILPDADPPPLRQPTQLGRYTIIEPLGQGGMGVVYAAHDPELNREVAVKVITAKRAASRWHRRALVREATAMARLSHPNIVQVFDVDTRGDRIFIAMELVRGQTLRQHLVQRRSWDELRTILLAIGEGVSAAHAAGIVHRDLKPGNILVGDDGRIAVTDFGLAAWLDDGLPTQPTDQVDPRHTAHGGGTPLYMAPEQHEGTRPIDPRADIFAFCTMAYEMLYETHPYAPLSTGSVAKDLATAKAQGIIEPPRRHDIPGWVRATIERGLAPDPDRRWPTMAALCRRLAAPRRARWVVGTVAAAITVLAMASADASPPCPQPPPLKAQWLAARRKLETYFSALPDVTGVHARVDGNVNEYIQAWTSAWHGACTIGNVSAMRARHACLQPAAVAVRTVWSAVDDADPAMAYRLDAAIDALPEIDDCLQRDAEHIPVARNEQEQAQRSELESDLARSIVLLRLGAYSDSQALLRGMDQRARQLGLPERRAAIVYEQASLAFNEGKLDVVAQAAGRAYDLAITHRDDAVARGAAMLSARAAAALGDPDDGRRWLRFAEAARERNPAADPMPWELALAHLHVEHGAGDLDAAYAAGQRALQTLRERDEPAALALAAALNDTANILLLQRELDRAQQYLVEAHDVLHARYGPWHPQVGVIGMSLGTVMFRLGKIDEAEQHMRQADAVFAKTTEALAGNRLLVSLNLGTMALARGDWTTGRERLLPVLDTLGATMGKTSINYTSTLGNIAAAELELEMLESARARYDEVLAIRETRTGPDSVEVAQTLYNLGLVELADGRLELAQQRLKRAEALLSEHAHPLLSSVLVGLADVAVAHDDATTAVRHLTNALALRRKGGFSPADVAEVQTQLEDLLTGPPTPR